RAEWEPAATAQPFASASLLDDDLQVVGQVGAISNVFGEAGSGDQEFVSLVHSLALRRRTMIRLRAVPQASCGKPPYRTTLSPAGPRRIPLDEMGRPEVRRDPGKDRFPGPVGLPGALPCRAGPHEENPPMTPTPLHLVLNRLRQRLAAPE